MNKEMDEGLQPLLIPYVFTVNSIEFSYLSEKLSTLTDLGIEIEEFGENSFKISALPVFLSSMNLQKFFDSILEDIYALKSISKTELLKEKLAMKACKSAIKSGDKLSKIDLETLTEKIQNNLGLKCPHGRPVAIKITRTEIDKWFKRIV
jgi:DNA mismatch repair protein MutL